MKDLERAKRQFRKARLSFPPLPEEFVPAFHSNGEWAWSTRDIDPMSMYMFEHFARSAQPIEIPDDYLAFCHAGHGITSYALTYHLVYRLLAIVFQVAWGGAYIDSAIATQEFAHQCELASGLVDMATTLRTTGIRTDGVGVVQYSSFRRLESFRVVKNGSLVDPRHAVLRRIPPNPVPAYAEARRWLAALCVQARGGKQRPTAQLVSDQLPPIELDDWTTLGRSPDSTVVVLDPRVSRNHASIFWDPQQAAFRLRDHASLHGTLLNGERLAPDVPRQLAHGDMVGIVAYRWQVRIVEPTWSGDGSSW